MKQTIRNSYYAYKLIDPRTDEVFYVGKGYSTRMYAHRTEALKQESEWTNPHKCRKIRNILDAGLSLKYEYVLCENENEALLREQQWIALYGIANEGGQLTNISKEGQVANPPKRAIDVYTTEGKFVRTFDSSAEATRILGISDESIIRRCLKEYDSLSTYKGLVFVYSGEPFAYCNTKQKVVEALKGTEVLVFNGTKNAAKYFARSTSCIRQCCANQWIVDGYELRYKNKG